MLTDKKNSDDRLRPTRSPRSGPLIDQGDRNDARRTTGPPPCHLGDPCRNRVYGRRRDAGNTTFRAVRRSAEPATARRPGTCESCGSATDCTARSRGLASWSSQARLGRTPRTPVYRPWRVCREVGVADGHAFGSPRRTTGAAVVAIAIFPVALWNSPPHQWPGSQAMKKAGPPRWRVRAEFPRCIRSEGGPMNQRELIRPDATIRYWTGGPDTAPTLVLLHGATLDHQRVGSAGRRPEVPLPSGRPGPARTRRLHRARPVHLRGRGRRHRRPARPSRPRTHRSHRAQPRRQHRPGDRPPRPRPGRRPGRRRLPPATPPRATRCRPR